MKRQWLVVFCAALFLLGTGPLAAGERVVVELKDGSRIEGELLKKDAGLVHISLAGQVVTLDRQEIRTIQTSSGEREQAENVQDFRLYKTATGVVRSLGAHAERLGPAIVTVKTPTGLGTGWFCRPDGYVVTNAHVIANDLSISITAFQRQQDRFENRVFKKVRIIAVNDDIDLALLKIEDDLGMEVPQLYIGDSTRLKEGDEVFTIRPG